MLRLLRLTVERVQDVDLPKLLLYCFRQKDIQSKTLRHREETVFGRDIPLWRFDV